MSRLVYVLLPIKHELVTELTFKSIHIKPGPDKTFAEEERSTFHEYICAFHLNIVKHRLHDRQTNSLVLYTIVTNHRVESWKF
jgi:hypothetical protein